ncbi:MAG: GIY-YIG nuclease family protein [Lentisphaeria bacterium]|nr:GIY-YIG nuclease family protein [Lentisphaeria bacterium]
MDIEAELSRIFAEDDLGLLDVKPKKSCIKTADQRLVDSFEQINDFVVEYGWEPKQTGSVIEKNLAYRLHGIRNSPEKVAALVEYDRFGLLGEVPEREYETLEDIFSDNDDMGLLDEPGDAEGIFTLKHIKAVSLPDYISRRKTCKNFERYKEKFRACQQELTAGLRQILPFKNGNRIDAGQFFILGGVLLYIDKIGTLTYDKNGDLNGRTRCIFENGLESDMRLRSLSSGLYKDGRRVTELEERLLDGMKDITEEDNETGYIYILKSKSNDPRIQSIENLYKIGYCTETVEERIANAAQEPTYLMAPVEVVDSFRCFNLNPGKLESLLHNFFGNSCLNIDVFDNNGQRHTPREWFIVPYEVIYQAIHFILNGEITDMRYDPVKQEIVGK